MTKNRLCLAGAGISALGAAGAVAAGLLKGACTGMIETAAGGAVPMKCHWSVRVCVLLGIFLLAISVTQFFIKTRESRLITAGMGLLLAAGLALTLSGLVIGVCGKEDMICRSTAALIRACAGLAAAGQLLGLSGAGADKPSKRF